MEARRRGENARLISLEGWSLGVVERAERGMTLGCVDWTLGMWSSTQGGLVNGHEV